MTSLEEAAAKGQCRPSGLVAQPAAQNVQPLPSHSEVSIIFLSWFTQLIDSNAILLFLFCFFFYFSVAQKYDYFSSPLPSFKLGCQNFDTHELQSSSLWGKYFPVNLLLYRDLCFCQFATLFMGRFLFFQSLTTDFFLLFIKTDFAFHIHDLHNQQGVIHFIFFFYISTSQLLCLENSLNFTFINFLLTGASYYKHLFTDFFYIHIRYTITAAFHRCGLEGHIFPPRNVCDCFRKIATTKKRRKLPGITFCTCKQEKEPAIKNIFLPGTEM